jgi:uncharacterized protein YndB with AHSA1/START domain
VLVEVAGSSMQQHTNVRQNGSTVERFSGIHVGLGSFAQETHIMIGPVLQHTIWVASPHERTWRAITETAQIKQWWGAGGYAEITHLAPNATITFDTTDGPLVATIRVVNPPHTFIYDWPPHPRYFSVPFTTTWRLGEEHGGTQVTFSESGFEAWPDDEARRARFERISEAFRMVLENLKAYLEGSSLPHVF